MSMLTDENKKLNYIQLKLFDGVLLGGDLKFCTEGLNNILEDKHNEIEKLKAENEKLKAESPSYQQQRLLILTEEQKELEEIGKIEEYMDWKRDGDGSLCEFIKTYLGHNDALEEVAREERELRFAAEAENERLKEENEKIKFNADEYEDSLCEIDELNGRIDKLEAWKESAKQQHLKDGTWVSQAREEELSDKIKSLESQLETERSMSEAGLVRGSSTGNCAWYRNLECLRKENDERGETTQRQRVEIEKLKAEMADFKRNVMRQHLIEYAELQVENAKLKAMNEYLNE